MGGFSVGGVLLPYFMIRICIGGVSTTEKLTENGGYHSLYSISVFIQLHPYRLHEQNCYDAK